MGKSDSLQSTLDRIHKAVATESSGKIASYIPQLASVDPNKFGIHLMAVDSTEFGAGDNEERFSIQSITKVLLLA